MVRRSRGLCSALVYPVPFHPAIKSKRRGREGKVKPTIVVPMVLLLSSHIFHFVHTPTLRTPLNRPILADGQPDSVVAVSGASSAAQIPLLPKALYNDRVIEGAAAGGVQRLHVKDVDTLDFTEDLETLETRSLVVIRRDLSRGGAGGEEVLFCFDLCI